MSGFDQVRLGTVRRRWTINGRFLTQSVTGVQRYGLEIVRALDGLIAAGHPLARGLDIELLMPRGDAAVPALAAIPSRQAGRLTGQAWEQLDLPRYAQGAILSLCNTSTLARHKQIVCIHDTSVWDYPASYTAPFRLCYKTLLPLLGCRAAALATVSHYSAAQLARHGVTARHEPTVIPNGHEHVLRWPRTGTGAAAPAGADFALVIGSLAPHKNLQMVLRLAELLRGSSITIAVAGAVDAAVFNRTELGGSGNVVWLGRLSDSELAGLLREALCLLFPSFVEGFGLPPLEAMAIGCPVIASDRASLPEVCGGAALYAPPDAPQAWHAALTRLRDNPRLRQSLIAKGHAQATRFSWQGSAEAYLGLMARLDGMPAALTTARAAE
jgi:glycosyltransferase involved in cell wall biosynthesis